jgi:DNA-binding MarR family transcriptional regulator
MSDPERHDPISCARAWQTLRLAHNRVAQRLCEALNHECGLSLSEFDALVYLRMHEHEEVRLSALLEPVALSQPALSRLVARLEQRGLIARSGAEDDRRGIALSLTTEGSTVADRAMAVQAQAVHEALTSKLSEADQESLLNALNRIDR